MTNLKTPHQITKQEAIDKLWRRGVISWKLDSCQKSLYKLYKEATFRKVVWNCARRIGKSYTLLIIALEHALQNKNSEIKYACPTAIMAENIIIPTIRKILEDCPLDIKPEYIKSSKQFIFKNGSIMQLSGTDEGNAEKLRGTASHLCVIDEAGFMDNLEYLIDAILLPQTITTGGKLLMASTPPPQPEHPFIAFIEATKLKNTYIKKTILDAVNEIQNDPPELKNRLNIDVLEEIKAALPGGENSITWKREYLCELIREESRLVIPEFNEKAEKEIVREWPRPERYDIYTAMDLGTVDNTAILYAYYDFKNTTIVIEGEDLMKGSEVTTKNISDIVKEKEAAIWFNPGSKSSLEPYLRISDDDLITLNDLYTQHNLTFRPTRKDNLEAAINEVRLKIQSKHIIINPVCKNLVYQVKTATWAKNRKTFTRSEQAGHYDLLAALIYLVRNVQYYKNPYPAGWGQLSGFNVFNNGQAILTNTGEAFKKLFKLKGSS